MVDLSLCRNYDRNSYIKMRNTLENHQINTVCTEANCPNRYHCFSEGTATFMILGKNCTRNCWYCDVENGKPESDPKEPQKLATIIKLLKLDYAVITSVTRDDLFDGGASVFESCVKEIKDKTPNTKIELLVPDFQGKESSIKNVSNLPIDVLNHNIEVVEELFPEMRPEGNYKLSIKLLEKAKEFNPYLLTKSGLIVGLGETKKQIENTMKDLRKADCDFLSIGQYLRPSKKHAEVKKYYSEKEFKELKEMALDLGFKHVESGTLVRSSFNAKGYI